MAIKYDANLTKFEMKSHFVFKKNYFFFVFYDFGSEFDNLSWTATDFNDLLWTTPDVQTSLEFNVPNTITNDWLGPPETWCETGCSLWYYYYSEICFFIVLIIWCFEHQINQKNNQISE